MDRCLSRLLLPLLLLLPGQSLPVSAQQPEVYLQLHISNPAQLQELSALVSIDAVQGSQVWAYALPQELDALQRAGYSWQRLRHPGLNPGARMGLAERAASGDWDAYPTYGEYVAMMEGFAAAYPELCRLSVIGASTNTIRPHQLLAVKISGDPHLEQDEPEVLLTSTMHGDETVGFMLLLRLIDELLRHYDPHASPGSYERQITALVDSMEIWINPLANPDGTFFRSDTTVDGALRRYVNPDGTASGVDPNRNFPDPDDGQHPDSRPWWQETVAMIEFAQQHSFVISANIHGGAELLNYPWDTWRRRHADDRWFSAICRAYADQAQQVAAAAPYFDSGYLRDRDNGVTNGYDWYSITGSRQDFMTYYHGDREVTMELSSIKNPPASQLPAFWDYNHQALLEYLGRAREGVRGLVRDAAANPLDATVEVAWYDAAEDASVVTTDADVGDYHRMLLPGSYWLVFRATGFISDVRYTDVRSGPASRVDVTLVADEGLTTSLSGCIRDAYSGQPIADALVEPLNPQADQVRSGWDGVYLLPDLPEGACLLEVSAPGYQLLQLGSQIRYPATTLDLYLWPPPPTPRRVAGRR